MNKVNIANYIIYDLANRFHGTAYSGEDEIIDMVVDTWHKKHFVSVTHGIKQHHSNKTNQKFII